MSAAVIEVFRCARRADCDERALVLAAIGIAATILYDGLEYTVQVDTEDAARAATQLGQYELERRPCRHRLAIHTPGSAACSTSRRWSASDW
jgi:hypothetical protein